MYILLLNSNNITMIRNVDFPFGVKIWGESCLLGAG